MSTYIVKLIKDSLLFLGKDTDHDYERRVGRHSGKSLVAGHEYDDVVADTCAVWDEDDDRHQAEVSDNPFDKLTPAQKADLESKANLVGNTFEKIIGLLEGLGNRISYAHQQPSALTQSLDNYFEELMKLNTQFDKQAMDVVNTAMSYGYPQSKLPELYKELLDELSE